MIQHSEQHPTKQAVSPEPIDIWALPASSSPQAERLVAPGRVSVTRIEGIEPLGRQLGMMAKKTVPDALRAILFGETEADPFGADMARTDPTGSSRLFTNGDGRAHLLDMRAGIVIRSRGTLDTVWRHFRKFTRVQDEAGQWFYLRFWEPDVLLDLAVSLEEPNCQRFFGDMAVIAPGIADVAYLVKADQT